MTKKPIVALIYDFDGTLSPGNMQEFGFIQAIGKDSKAFWGKNKKLSEDNDASGILCYMYLMLQAAQAESISLSRESFRNFGKDVELFKGVKEWFTLINNYGKSVGVNIEHYINSSGLTEMITPEDKVAGEKIKSARRPPLNYKEMGIEEGEILVFEKDPSIEIVIAGEKKVIYKGEVLSLTALTKRLLNIERPLHPTGYWTYNGENLRNIYDRVYTLDD